MTWQTILKATRGSQGLHVTKFYMFLKRWLADEHTKQFRRDYLLFDELEETYEKRDVANSLERILVSPHAAGTGREIFPGITIITLDETKIDLKFDDIEHIGRRKEWVEDSDERVAQSRRLRQGYTEADRMPWWEHKPPYDSAIQRAWRGMSRRIKKSSNYHWRWRSGN
tara:strand:+ start:1325 stop:1831 length:507 start_codon:yes stop_codon:yes gene_type:complete